MLRPSLRGLIVAAMAAAALAVPAEAVTPIVDCGVRLDKAGETYVLTADITTAPHKTCWRVTADRVTIDLAGHTIDGASLDEYESSPGIAIFAPGVRGLVVKNGTITGFGFGINAGPRATIRDITISGTRTAILVEEDALVTRCIVRGPGGRVIVGDRGHVEGCLLEHADRGGLAGGDRMLVARNIVRGNGFTGVVVGDRSVVMSNTVNGNQRDGIRAGPNSVVVGNTANDNRWRGISVTCPSTVFRNHASGNDRGNFEFFRPGCFSGYNSSADEDDPQ